MVQTALIVFGFLATWTMLAILAWMVVHGGEKSDREIKGRDPRGRRGGS